MSASPTNRRPCPDGFAAARLAKATGFMEAADLAKTFDEGTELRDAYVTLWIHSGIASADYLCCERLGEFHSSENPAQLLPYSRKSIGNSPSTYAGGGKCVDQCTEALTFLSLLNSNEVEYLPVGGFAVSFHGYPREPKARTY